MKKTILSFVFLLIIVSVNAQETTNDSIKLWTKKGNISLLFNQTAFNNKWLGGGTSNLAGNFGLNYDFNYKKGDIVWDNKFIAAYGLTKVKGSQTSKTDDRLELNSLWGKKAKGDWYYSLFFNFKTQMDVGYDKDGNNISHFFSPAYFQLGPGMLWKKSNHLSVNFSPATAKLIIVHPHFTDLSTSFGVLQGDSSRFEFGASISGYYKLIVMANISIENRINLYSNYLDQPQNVDIDYQMNILMRINKYVSANLALQGIYDDNTIKALQVREVFGLSANYGF